MAKIIPLRGRARPQERINATLAASDGSSSEGNGDLLVASILFWIASIGRVSLVLVRHERFGVEATLALLCAVTLPWGLLRMRNESTKLSSSSNEAESRHQDALSGRAKIIALRQAKAVSVCNRRRP